MSKSEPDASALTIPAPPPMAPALPHIAPKRRNALKGWKTTPFILGNEVTERIAAFGLTWSLVLYLVHNYNMTGEVAAYVLAVSSGITGLTPLIGGFVADTYLGRYRTIIIGSFSYFLGMVCLLLTATVRGLTPAACARKEAAEGKCEGASSWQLAVLYTAFALMAVGAGGVRPCVYAFGADQFGQETEEERRQLQSFFNWYYVGVMVALLVSSTVIAYLQLEVSWSWGFGVPVALMALSILFFLSGSHLYAYVSPSGSPLSELARVSVAAFLNRNLPLPADPSKLHFASSALLPHTPHFRFLDKAAVKVEEEGQSKWRLCRMEEVESLKCVLRVAPVWAAGMIPNAFLAQQATWIPLQAIGMNRRLGSSGFSIPASSMAVFSILATITFLPFYDRALPRILPEVARRITILRRIGTGYGLLVFSALVAAAVESVRRHSSHRLSAMWLVPQLLIFGVAEAFNIVGQLEYLYKEMPPHMRSLAGALFSCSMALGSFVGSIVLATAQGISGHTWINNENLRKGHLDYYYYYFAAILLLNFIYFMCISNFGKNHYRPIPDKMPRHMEMDSKVEPISIA